MLRSPGRSDFVAGTTTAAVLLVIHASLAPPIFRVAAFATSVSDEVCIGCGRFVGINVGSREGVGDGGGWCPVLVVIDVIGLGCCWRDEVEDVAAATAAAFAADVVRVVASRGILLGP